MSRPLSYYSLPYVLALSFPLLVLASNVMHFPPLFEIAETVGIILGSVAILHALVYWWVRRSPAAELIVTAIVFNVFSYGYAAYSLFHGAIPHFLLVPVWLVVLALFIVLIYRNVEPVANIRFISLLQWIVVPLVLLQMVIVGPRLWAALQDPGPTAMFEPLSLDIKGKPASAPDIYYIILDAYARADTLKEVYHHDNSDFLAALDKRGFFVAREGCTNYQCTRLSLPSSLNLAHLVDLPPGALATRDQQHALINNCRLVRFLKEQGYRTVALATDFPPVGNSTFDQYDSGPGILHDYPVAMLSTTWILPVAEQMGSLEFHTTRRQCLKRHLQMLPEVAQDAQAPTFVYAHIVAPHRPFLYDAEGNELGSPHSFWVGGNYLEPGPANRHEYIERYRDYLVYTNGQVLQVVDRILAGSRPAIIILQADHGPCALQEDESQKDNYLRERFTILNAIHVPAGIRVELYDDMTPVNTFRLILNGLFQTKLDQLPDRCYFDEPMFSGHYTDVTDVVRARKVSPQ